ncbi:MAG: O-antigen polymerase [Oribacterium sp.]
MKSKTEITPFREAGELLWELLLFSIATVLSYRCSRRESYPASGFFLIAVAFFLYFRNRSREGGLLNLPGLFALGLLGGEGIACFHLSRLGTVWSRETWLSFYLSYLVFLPLYRLFCRLLRERTGRKERAENMQGRDRAQDAERAAQNAEIPRHAAEGIAIALGGLLVLSTLCFLIEAAVLGFIPLFTVATPHAYSSFHLPGIHYFTTLSVLCPSIALLYRLARRDTAGDTEKRHSLLQRIGGDPLLFLGLLLPWLLTVLMVSRFQFLFSVLLLLFTAYFCGLRLRREHLLAVFLGMLVIYVLLTAERAHSIRYLNEIFEMKNPAMPIFVTQPYMYIANNYDNFNVMTEQLTEHSHGMRMLYPFVTLSALKYLVELPLAFPLFTTKAELTTVTLLYDAWYDFGIPGVLLFSAALSFLSALCTEGLRRAENPFACLIAAQLAFYLLFSFFTTWFSNPSTLFYLVWSIFFYIFYGICNKNKRKA